mmetsp:Transcript_6328/g.20961  ORF Transcript_6328/g.20961 Transcript_6328/m.20961 type:complete len:211 (-) Transcript_6328:830-1462(-)
MSAYTEGRWRSYRTSTELSFTMQSAPACGGQARTLLHFCRRCSRGRDRTSRQLGKWAPLLPRPHAPAAQAGHCCACQHGFASSAFSHATSAGEMRTAGHADCDDDRTAKFSCLLFAVVCPLFAAAAARIAARCVCTAARELAPATTSSSSVSAVQSPSAPKLGGPPSVCASARSSSSVGRASGIQSCACSAAAASRSTCRRVALRCSARR